MNIKPTFQKAIVTGATSGIGAATVKALSAAGMEVLAVARRQAKLEALSKETGCRWLAVDVRDILEISAKLGTFAADVIINNAGVGHGISGMEDLDPVMIQEAVDVNVVAPMQLVLATVPGMRQRGQGHIVNVGSIAGLHTLLSAVYGGTKAAIHQFSQNLRYELRGSGIRVTEICPGRVASEFYEAAVGDPKKLARMQQSDMMALQPEDVADVILFALNAPLHVNISTIELLPTEQAVGGVDVTLSSSIRKGNGQ